MKRITIEYDDIEAFKYAQELQQKGEAFDDFNRYLRECLKYERYKEFLTELKLEHKVMQPAVEDIVYNTCRVLREKLYELLLLKED